MMSAANWRRVRGYPELPTHGATDCLLTQMAIHAGLRQVFLASPMRLFHVEHDRAAHSERPATNMHHFATSLENPNSESWGLAGVELPETARSFGG